MKFSDLDNTLNDDQKAFFQKEGYLFPFTALTEQQALALRTYLENYEREKGSPLYENMFFKVHLVFKCLADLARSDNILSAVTSLIGSNVRLFASNFWIKEPNKDKFVSWHQDTPYLGFDQHESVNVWIGLSKTSKENGCLRVMPQTHDKGIYEHVETFDSNNMLSRGQTIHGLDDTKAVYFEMKPGQFSIHHENMIHGSLPNRSDDRRVGFNLVMVPTHVGSADGIRRTSSLVCGVDEYGYWDDEPVPQTDEDPVCMEYMERGAALYRKTAHAT